MENNIPNDTTISSKGGNKPYERKIKINQQNKKINTNEDDEDKKETENIIIKPEIRYESQIQDQNIIKGESKEEIQEYINNNYDEEEYLQEKRNKNSENIQIEQHEIENNINNENNIQEKKYYKNDINKDIDDNIQIENQFKYGEEEEYEEENENENENGQKKEFEKDKDKYNYKYKKIQINTNEIEREEENEENEEQNEEEDIKEETDKFDYQEIKKKPGRILHQSTQETFDEEGNRIVTTKTIKEFKQTTGGIRIRNIQNEKEKIEYERYTTNNIKNNKALFNNRKTNVTYKSDNKGDRVYLLAQLAKLKNDAEKNKLKKYRLYNNSQSPIIIHDSNGYEIYENQNSMFSNELIDPNSFDEEMYERNYNYRNNYGTINNLNINNQDYREGYFYPSQQARSRMNEMQEEYFGENDSSNNRKEIPSPIGYIATYSSGSEDNEEIGRSYEQYNYNNNYYNNNRITNVKNKTDKNKYKKEGELIKKSEIIYQLEDPNDYIGFNEKKKNKNLSNICINTQIDTSKSDKKDFQSPDRGAGLGSERFRKVTMAMISSLGPTCEDRKITRKMRSEVGGVVDLRQELNPVNTYKIKKFQRSIFNINKEVNPKTKLEGARLIQYWWRSLKDRKIYMIKYIKIVKIQSFIRRFLVRKKIITTRITYYIYEILDNIINNNYRNELLKLFKYNEQDKAKKKFAHIINKLNDKNLNQKLLKYFYKYKYITELLKNQINYQPKKEIADKEEIIISEKEKKNNIYEEIKETEITEEMYIKYFKEKNINNNKPEHINQLSIDKKEKKPYEIGNETKYEIKKTKKELIDKQTQDEYEKKEYKDMGTQQEKEKMLISKKEPISYISTKTIEKIEKKDINEYNKIQSGDIITYIKKQSTKDIPNKIINQDKLSIIHNKPLTKEDGVEGGNINIHEISENNSLLFPNIKKVMIEEYTEAKPEQIIKLDSKTEISIIKPKKELKESSTQKEIEENKINKLNQISFLYQKPKTNDQGIGNFTLNEGIDKTNINFIKEKKEFKDSETQPIKQNMELTTNNLSIIKPIKQYVENNSQYRDPNLPTDKNKEIYKLANKKINKEKLYLGSVINRWRKIALGEKIKDEIDNQRIEKLKNIMNIKNNFLKKYLKIKFEEFITVCKIPEKKIEPIKNDDFNIVHMRPENEKIQLDGFMIEKKEKPSLKIDKNEDYNILKIKKIFKDEETQDAKELVENGVNPEVIKNEIIKNELINIINQKKETLEEGTNPTKINNEISNISSFNYTTIPKKLVDTETEMEIAPKEICTNEPLNIIKPKKEYTETSFQYIDPSKPTSYEELLKIIIKRKIIKNDLNLRKYLNKWYKIIKEDIINNKANTIIKNVKGHLIRNKIKNNENIKNGLEKLIDIYEKIITKQTKINSEKFITNCKREIESKRMEPKQGEYFSITDIRPENKEEKINEIHLKPKDKIPYEINNLENVDILGKIKNYQDFGTQNIPNTTEEGTQNEIIKNEINNKNELTFLHSKKEMKDEYSQNETYKNEITNDNLNIISKIEKQEQGHQIGVWANIIKKNESLNIISNIPKKEEKIIVPNSIKQTVTLEIIKNKKELQDQEIQYIPEENKIETQEIIIKSSKPETKENSSQYISTKPIISSINQYSILGKKKELIKYIIEKNNINYIHKKKELIEQGEQYDIPQEYKSKELIIGNSFKKGKTLKVIEIFEKIWVKKEKIKFMKNIKDTAKETMIKRELLRMALLRWRFIKGYGGDRYGIIYDRNGKEIGKKEGLVNDVSIQNDLYEEIEKEKKKNKLLRIKVSKQNPVYIKSNIKPKIMLNMGTGDGPNHIINSKIDKNTNLSYIRKPKPKNKISNKNSFKINSIEKKMKSEGTYMAPKIIKVVKENKLLFNGADNKLRNIKNRRRDLLMQIISKNMIKGKYILNNYFSKWYKKTMKYIYIEKNKTIIEKTYSSITHNVKSEISQKSSIISQNYRNRFNTNKIVHNSKIEFKNNKIKKDVGITINLPNSFKNENLRTRKINNDIYKSYKKPIILRQTKGESTSILGQKITSQLSNELGAPIGKEIEDEINIRITEIFVKFIKSRTSPICILRKYLSIWHRKAQYIPLLENARIISEFCKSKLNSILVGKKWKKLYTKYLLSAKQYNIMKIVKILRRKRYKLIRLIRLTRLITVFNKRKYLHYIIMSWLIYTITTIKKRNQIKMLYENMLTTYVSMADDIFGKNKKNNPSIQDCMFEIIDTDKYQIKELEDVPIAKIYYSKKNGQRKIYTNLKYIEKEIEGEKDTNFYKKMAKSYYSPSKLETYKIKTEENDKDKEKDNKSEKMHKRIYSLNNVIDNKNTQTLSKYGRYKIDTNTNNANKEKNDNSEKIGSSHKRIYSLNNVLDNKNTQPLSKYGRLNNNTYKIDTNTNANKEKDNNSEKVGNSHKRIYSLNNVIDNKNTQTLSKYGRLNNNTYKIDTNTNVNKEKDNNSEKVGISHKRIYSLNNVIDNKNTQTQTLSKYGRLNNNTYKIDTNTNADNINVNNSENRTSKSNVTYGRRNNNYANTETNNNNKMYINNRYSDIKTETKEIDNQLKENSLKTKYNLNKYKYNNINDEKPKNEEKINVTHQNYYISKYTKYNANTENNNNKNKYNIQEDNNKDSKDNISKYRKYYTKTKPEEKVSYKYNTYNASKYKIEDKK